VIDHEQVFKRFLSGESGKVSDALKTVPATIKLPLVVGVFEKLVGERWLGPLCKNFHPRLIRAVLQAKIDRPNHLFLRLAVPLTSKDPGLVKAWAHALDTLSSTAGGGAWGGAARRAKIAKLVADKPILAAIQGTVAHSDEVSLMWLAVLAADGSDASYDALVRHIDIAFTERDRRLDTLSRLSVHAARTPALDALLSEVDEALQDRNATSSALRLGPVIGIGKVEELWFTVRVESTTKASTGVPRIVGDVRIDSRSASWFSVSLTTVDPRRLDSSKDTSFDERGLHLDTLELGSCQPEELPGWLVKAAAKLKTTWEPFAPRSNLRGKKRDQIGRWLASGRSRRRG
jgi:hypothetical protein